jgi:hypothetical protein
MVFTTGHGGEETLWTMTIHEPESGVAEYLRVTPGSRMGTVRVQCSEAAAGTKVTVTYALTALTPEGNATLQGLDAAAYRAFIEAWGTSICEARARNPSESSSSCGRRTAGVP